MTIDDVDFERLIEILKDPDWHAPINWKDIIDGLIDVETVHHGETFLTDFILPHYYESALRCTGHSNALATEVAIVIYKLDPSVSMKIMYKIKDKVIKEFGETGWKKIGGFF